MVVVVGVGVRGVEGAAAAAAGSSSSGWCFLWWCCRAPSDESKTLLSCAGTCRTVPGLGHRILRPAFKGFLGTNWNEGPRGASIRPMIRDTLKVHPYPFDVQSKPQALSPRITTFNHPELPSLPQLCARPAILKLPPINFWRSTGNAPVPQ